MTDHKPSVTDNIALISKLYPKAIITDPQWENFREFCGMLDQAILAQAIRWVAHYKSAREPSWRAFSERYAAIKQEATYTPEPRYSGTMTWHVSWQRTAKHGVPGAWYGCRVQSREEAEQIAKERGGRVTCMSKADDDDDYSDEALAFLVRDAYQTEGEARLKVVRAKQSSVQLSTYFAGRTAMMRLRNEIQREQHEAFSLGRYHEAVLSAGSVPVKLLPSIVRRHLATTSTSAE